MAFPLKQSGPPDHLLGTIPQGGKPADEGGIPAQFVNTIRAAEQSGEESSEAGAEGASGPFNPPSNGALPASVRSLIAPSDPSWNTP